MNGGESTVHGTAFLVGDVGILAMGPSGAGKSRLVVRLAAGMTGDIVRLVADDRVRLTAANGRLVARPIDGFLGTIEMRGIGISNVPAMPSAIIRGIVRLLPERPERIPDQPFAKEELLGIALPAIRLLACDDSAQDLISKWLYFRRMIHTTC